MPFFFFQILISKNFTPLWQIIHLQVKINKIPYIRIIFFLSFNVSKLYIVTTKTHSQVKIYKIQHFQNTFLNSNTENTPL